MQKSIRQDLSIRLGFVIFCINIVIGIVYYSFSIHYHEKEFKNSIKHQTKYISDTFTLQLWLFDLNTTRELCKLLSESPEVSGLRLLDHKKEVVFEQEPSNKEANIHVSEELRYEGEKLVGYVDIFYSNTYREQEERNVLFVGILMVIGTIMGTFIFINILLKRYLSRPLEDFKKDMLLLAHGDFQQSRLVGQKTEIQNIIDTFNKLTISLREKSEEVARKTEAFRENEEKYRSLVESTQDSIYVVNRNCTYLFMNKRHLARLNMPENNATGKTYREFHSAGDTQEFIKKVEKVFASGAPFQHEHKSHRDGKHFLRALSPIIGPDGRTEAVTVVSADITDRVQAEEEQLKLQDKLHRSQKMEALGLLAGGVAHDLNNILSGIVSYPELLLMDLPGDSPLRRPIEVIQESGMRAADVVGDLLTMARGVATGKEALNLNTLIAEYLESPESQTLEKTHSFVNLKTEMAPDLLNMSGSPTHIKKTLMNLVVNASEAIEGAGTVTILTINRYLDEPLKGYEDVLTGEYVVLSVSDDGSGISPQDLKRIFEPFYTKKEMGRSGTGLGLAVVWNTVQDHNGYINVNTSEKGTVFELYFPVTRDEVTVEKEKVPLEGYLGHGEKILVVDDEERQRMIASGMLTKLGYNPEAVSSGEEAIEYMKENAVDLIVLDMVMPKGINGRATYEQIIKIRPDQKVIIASGYAKTKEVNTAQELGAGKYIKKPYILEKIGLAVKEELEK